MQTKYGAPDTGANGQTPEAGTTVVSLTSEDLTRAKAQLAERITAAKASVERMGRAVADGTRHAVRATDRHVRDRPWQAIGIGTALGVLIGFLAARRE